MAERFALVDVADVYLHHRDGGNGPDGIVECDGSVGIGTSVEDDTVATFAPCLLQTVDEGSFVVRLKTVNLNSLRCIPVAQTLQHSFQAFAAVDAGLSLPEHVEVGAVDDDELHG